MEYNFLLLKDNKLSIQQDEFFLELNQENLDTLKAEYLLISTYEIKNNSPISSNVLKLLKNNDVVINFENVSSALKEIEDNKIITHLNRENFRKISFPIFVKTHYLKNYLEVSDLKFELSSFIKNSKFQKIELDS